MKRFVNTAETYYRFNFIILLAVCVPLMLLCLWPLLLVSEDPAATVGLMLVMIPVALPMLGFVIYYLVQYLYYRNVELSFVQEAVLGPTSTGMMRLVGFRTVVMINGVERAMTTKRVFNASVYGVNPIDNYSGRTALVGYNAARDELVVISG